MKVWLMIACAVLVIVATIWGAGVAVQSAYQKGRAEASETLSKKRLKAEFDRGMKAGVEYQEWFCENEVGS